jgi:excisionase family DNA binding protein
MGKPTNNRAAPTDRLLAVAEAADYCGVGERMIRRLVAERRIAFVKLGKHVRLSTVDLDAFIAAGRVEPGRGPSDAA